MSQQAIPGPGASLRSAAWASLALFALVACGPRPAEPERPPKVDYPMSDVVAQRLDELGILDGAGAPAVVDEEVDPDLAARVRDAVGFLANAQGEFRNLAFEDLASLGDPAIPILAETLMDPEAEPNVRIAATEGLGRFKTPASARALLAGVARGEAPWLRSWSSYYLKEAGQDEVALDLALRLRYEKDPEVVVWLGVALERLDCLATVEAIRDIAAGPDEGRGVALARAQLAEIEQRRGKTADELIALWESADAGVLQTAPPSDTLRAKVWRAVAELSAEKFQLRNVDDARFQLSRMGAWVGEELGLALRDSDLGIRLHVSQVLERLGPRARATEGALIAALDEPLVAPAAAEALARVGAEDTLQALILRSAPPYPYELQVACVRALGRLKDARAFPHLLAGFERATQPGMADLRQIAAAALVELSADLPAETPPGTLTEYDVGVPHLYEVLVAGGPEGAAAEATLDLWLRDRAEREIESARTALEAWDDHGVPPSAIPKTEVVQARRAARAERLAPLLGG